MNGNTYLAKNAYENESPIKYYDYSTLLSLYPGLYPGMTTIENQTLYSSYYLMNWGYDGSWDDGLYSMLYPSWHGFDENKTINYNLVPKELLLNQ